MPRIIDVIDDYKPANNEVGTPLNSTIEIVFDGPMDETILADQVFVEGPDTDQFVGPGFELLGYPNNISQGGDFLSSPGMRGLLQGTTSFQKVSTTDAGVIVSSAPYRTKMIITPDHVLSPLTEYTVNIPDFVTSGDITYSGYLTYTFTTGNGSITQLPTETSTSIITTALENTLSNYFAAPGSNFKVLKTWPKDDSVQVVASGVTAITVEFNSPVDLTSLSDDNVSITSYPATGHPTALAEAIGNIPKTLTAVGNKLIATLENPDNLLRGNNLIEVILASGIKDTNNSYLGDEFSFRFLTTAYPAYSDVMKVRLEGAGFIGNLDDITIELAILEASLEADALVFNKNLNLSPFFIHARREWVTCKALLMLLVNLGNGLLKSKTLDNLSVSYDTGGLQTAMDKAYNCMLKWEGQIITGGTLKSTGNPMGVVKGSADPDRPVVGRLWVPVNRGGGSGIPAGNDKARPFRRAFTTFNPNKKFW